MPPREPAAYPSRRPVLWPIADAARPAHRDRGGSRHRREAGTMTDITAIRTELHAEEIKLLTQLREVRQKKRIADRPKTSLGNRVADSVAATVGSWRFII